MKINFEEVALHGCRKERDAKGRLRTKRKKFYQTINPFNLSKAGVPKSRFEIELELQQERADWEAAGERAPKRQPLDLGPCKDT